MPDPGPLRLNLRKAPDGVDFARRVVEIASFPDETLRVATGDGPQRIEVSEALVSIPEQDPGPGGRLVFHIHRDEAGRDRVHRLLLEEPDGNVAALGGLDVPLARLEAWLKEAAEDPAGAELPAGWFRGRDLQVLGGAANEDLAGRAGDDLVRGGAGDDLLRLNRGDDVGRGGGDGDMIFGGAGADAIRGGRGEDVLSGGAGGDDIFGGRGADEMRGGAGADRLHGGRGSDRLNGGTGDDSLAGGAGDDRLSGGAGDDLLTGGGRTVAGSGGARAPGDGPIAALADSDVFVLDGAGVDTVTDFQQGLDRIELAAGVGFEDLRFETVGDDLRLLIDAADRPLGVLLGAGDLALEAGDFV